MREITRPILSSASFVNVFYRVWVKLADVRVCHNNHLSELLLVTLICQPPHIGPPIAHHRGS